MRKVTLITFVVLAVLVVAYIVWSPVFSFGVPTEVKTYHDISTSDRAVLWGYAVFHYPEGAGPTHAGRLIPSGRFLFGYNEHWQFYFDYENHLGKLLVTTKLGVLTSVSYLK